MDRPQQGGAWRCFSLLRSFVLALLFYLSLAARLRTKAASDRESTPPDRAVPARNLQAFLAQGFPQGAYAMQAPAPYGLQLHPLNENGALGVPVGTPMMGTPVQQPPPQRGVPEQPAMNPVMGFAAAPQQHS